MTDLPPRLELWWLSRDGSGGVYLRGDIYGDPPPRSYPDGDGVTSSHLDEEQQRRAVEGTIVSTASGRRYILELSCVPRRPSVHTPGRVQTP